MKKTKSKKNLLIKFQLIITMILLIQCSSNNDSNIADLVITNAKIYTVDQSNPLAEAIAVKNDTIMFVGKKKEVEKFIGDATQKLDLNGKFVMPGIIESHAHFLGLGKAKMVLELQTLNNWDEIIALTSETAGNIGPGEWVVGRGWHQEKWDPIPEDTIEGYPTHNFMSEMTQYNPVMLTHASGHALFANAKAMELAGVNKETPNPEGGKIVRDKNGNPTGIFEENAEKLILEAFNKSVNQKSKEELERNKIQQVELAVKECLKFGITSFHDAGESFDNVDFIKTMVDSNKIPIRLYVMLRAENIELEQRINNYKIIGYGNNHLTVRSIKLYVDGALGSRGAWLLDDYTDLPGSRGQNVTSIKSLTRSVRIAMANGFQVGAHAIGDRGNREVLNIYKKILNENPDSTDRRWRIEHAQHLNKKDISRFSKLGVLPIMQAVHCTSDAIFVPKRLGMERSEEGAYVWRKLMDAGSKIANGTDAPVEGINPFQSFYSSVTRKLDDGTEFFPEQKMTRKEAIEAYTINGAFASFEENIKGSLSKGKLADLIVLSKNLATIPDDEILSTKVLFTIIGGKIVYQSDR